MTVSKEYYYPTWLRIWHIFNVLLFIALIFTGINMHYASIDSPVIKFQNAILVHNISGIMLTANYLFFFVANLVSGNYMQYIPKLKGLVRRLILQSKYYVKGIFKHEPHPFHTSPKMKFNPLQQVTYLNIMYVVFPIIILSGWALLFPEFIIEKVFSISGLLLTAIVHTVAGFLLSLFMLGHIYLATTGTTVLSNFKSIITGWHELHNEQTKLDKAQQ